MWAAFAIAGPVLIVVVIASTAATADNADDWRESWGASPGFTIEADASGLVLPTSLTFVPRPGGQPGDPLYFVTELRGSIKVVSNDRSVTQFAEVGTFDPTAEYPDLAGEGGLAGLCVAPEHGYVFATYSHRNVRGFLQNGMTRFQASASTFTGSVTELNLDHIFAGFPSALSHQIGPCQVEGDALYVSVGDGANPRFSRDREQLLGKVVKMTLDGLPYPDNPFPEGGGSAPFVWALGLRNPFGLDVVEGEVFVADNGPVIDRFLRVESGGDYLWDGTDASIGAAADVVMSPALGPVQLERYPRGSDLFPQSFQEAFYVAASVDDGAGVVMLPYDLAADRATAGQTYLVKWRDTGDQNVAGMAFGPDGLYFAPVIPDRNGVSTVFRIRHDPEAAYPYGLETGAAEELMIRYGCRSCHQLGGVGGAVGPALDRNTLGIRIRTRLDSPEYRQLVEDLDQLNEEPFSSWRDERAEILETRGGTRAALWVTYRLLEPRFDNPDAQMPNLGLSRTEAERIAIYLAGGQVQSATDRIIAAVFGGRRGLALTAIGFVGGLLTAFLVGWLVRRRRRHLEARLGPRS